MSTEGVRINERIAAEGMTPFPPGDPALERLGRFAGEVARWGRRTHLVGKSRIEENVLISLLDSLHLIRFAERSDDLGRPGGGRRSVADIGSGAGFPGIVWAIARPDIAITLYERREKPRLFLERTIRLLGIGGTAAVEGEAAGGDGMADIVLSKAAGRLDEMAPIARRFLRPGGSYLTIKGEGWRREISSAPGGGMDLAGAEELPGGRGTMLRLLRSAGA